jgi:hypothetical protein
LHVLKERRLLVDHARMVVVDQRGEFEPRVHQLFVALDAA